jgi:hypothetical protein
MIGSILIAAGVAGLVYSMPIVSNAIALKSKTEPAALGKAPIPVLSSSDTAIFGVEIASIPALIAGISFMAIGQSKVYKVER